MTKVYFVRHAEPNYGNHDDAHRELSPKGIKDRKLVTEFLSGKKIDVILSSPYKRAVDTVRDFAEKHGMEIEFIDDFRERRVDSGWIEDFSAFVKKQWCDFNFKLSDGECLKDVQERNVSALNEVLKKYPGKHIVIGRHGTALSTVINYYDQAFGYNEFEEIKSLMPWIVEFSFDESLMCTEIKMHDLFIDSKWKSP